LEPEAAAFPSIAFKIAVWIWTRNAYIINENKPAKKGNLNLLADGTFHNFTLLTHSLTTSVDNLKSRSKSNDAAILALKCTALKRGRGVDCEFGAKFGFAVPICLIDYKKTHCGCEGDFGQTTCPYGYTSSGQCRSSSIIKCCDEKCQRYLDLLIILDSSQSITFDHYTLAKKFVRSLVEDLDIGENATHVALINYSKDSEIIFKLNSIYDKKTLLSTIEAIEHQNGVGTNTQQALYDADAFIFQEANGMRPNSKGIPKVVVVITDGASNIKPNLTVPNALKLKYRGISIVSVGVGDDLNQYELDTIATNSDDVYNVDDYDKIFDIIDSLSRSICEQSARVEIGQVIEATISQSRYTYFKIDFEYILANLVNLSSSTNFTNFINLANIPEQFSVGITDVKGKTNFAFSFDDETPKDTSDYIFDNSTSSGGNFVENRGYFLGRNSNEKLFEVCRPANSTVIFIGIKGLDLENTFRIFVYNKSVSSYDCDGKPIIPTISFGVSIQQRNIYIVIFVIVVLTIGF
jgi:hypothetical protein